jgi:molecular chaperone GrpE (heat shock protein)
MEKYTTELESLITINLTNNINLINEVEKKELEKHDQLKEIALSIIDVIDSFERIEEGLNEKGFIKNENDELLKLSNRYKSIQKKLLNILQRHGITKIEFPENRLIVGLCEVIDTENHSNRKNDDIISVIRNGYIRGKELIRAAQLIIVKN